MHWDCHDVFNESSIKLTLTFIRTPDGHYNVQWKEKQSLLWIVLTAATVNMVNPPPIPPTYPPHSVHTHSSARWVCGLWMGWSVFCLAATAALFWWMKLLSGRWLSSLQTCYHTPGSPHTHTLSSKHRPQASKLHRERMVSIGICVSIGLQVYRTSEDKCISIIFTWQVFFCLFIWLTVWNEIEKAQSFNHWASTATFFHGNVTCQSTLVGRKHF